MARRRRSRTSTSREGEPTAKAQASFSAQAPHIDCRRSNARQLRRDQSVERLHVQLVASLVRWNATAARKTASAQLLPPLQGAGQFTRASASSKQSERLTAHPPCTRRSPRRQLRPRGFACRRLLASDEVERRFKERSALRGRGAWRGTAPRQQLHKMRIDTGHAAPKCQAMPHGDVLREESRSLFVVVEAF
jgi:hypothetical protein